MIRLENLKNIAKDAILSLTEEEIEIAVIAYRLMIILDIDADKAVKMAISGNFEQ